jgi:KaiC/GvpD/RAD55 family RecA-like ATPase
MPANKISLGIPALNDLFPDGVPTGYTVLILSSPGTGAELFAKQFAVAGVGYEHVIYFSTLERKEDVLNTMREYGWKPEIAIVDISSEYYETVLAKDLEVSKYRLEGIDVGDVKRFTADEQVRRPINFLTRLTYEVSKLKPPFRIVINSIDFFLEHYDHKNVLSAIRTIRAHTLHQGGIALISMQNKIYDTRTQGGIEEIVDCIIELERQREGLEFRDFIVIKKVRNHPEKTGIVGYQVTDDGIQKKK